MRRPGGGDRCTLQETVKSETEEVMAAVITKLHGGISTGCGQVRSRGHFGEDGHSMFKLHGYIRSNNLE